MAFNKKTWKDRVSEQPQRRLLTPTDGGEAMTVDVTRQEGIVIQEGDAFSAANMNDLETRIKNTFDSDESTLAAVNTKANTNASNISTLQTNLTSVSNRVTTNANNIAANKTTETNHYNALATRATNLENELTANSKRIYMDYKNGKYGINTSANRGADTFIPFSSYEGTSILNEIFYEEGEHTFSFSATSQSYYLITVGGSCYGGSAEFRSIIGGTIIQSIMGSLFSGFMNTYIIYVTTATTVSITCNIQGSARGLGCTVIKFK